MLTGGRNAEAAIAFNRFGLGRKFDEEPLSDARSWLRDQIEQYDTAPPAFGQAQNTQDIAAGFLKDRQELAEQAADAKDRLRQALQQANRQLYRAEVEMRGLNVLTTPTPFAERLVHFWSNHFAVSADKPQITALAGAFEREAIRPHVMGRFADILLAVERHPAMLFFLDQVRSAGPNSRFARNAEKRNAKSPTGINENLAREVMELHTLGAQGGYDQHDVTEFALALTGWSVSAMGPRGRSDEAGLFLFRPGLHEPGARTILGKRYDQNDEEQARSLLADLAAREETAQHIALKLCRHFVSDDPPSAVVDRVRQSFLASAGDLPTIYRALIDAPESWRETPAKLKTPWEWSVSGLRGLGYADLKAINFTGLLNQLGQPVWRPGSPAGYDDIAASWLAPNALMRRVEVAQRLAAKAPIEAKPQDVAKDLLSGDLDANTEQQLSRAESIQTGYALLLAAPAFQRR